MVDETTTIILGSFFSGAFTTLAAVGSLLNKGEVIFWSISGLLMTFGYMALYAVLNKNEK